MKYDLQTYIDSIRMVAEQIEKSPTQREYDRNRKSDQPDSDDIIRVIGSWSGAKAMAGLDPESEEQVSTRGRSSYENEDIINAVQYVCEQTDGTPTVTEYRSLRRDDDPSYETIYNRYKDQTDSVWKTVLEQAECETESVGKKAKFTKEDCSDAIQRVNEMVENNPTQSQYKAFKDDSDPSLTTVKDRFGGWTKALVETLS